MITLDVQPYCENCPAFEADVYTAKAENPAGDVIVSTVIYCEHRKTCTNFIRYLKKELAKGEVK